MRHLIIFYYFKDYYTLSYPVLHCFLSLKKHKSLLLEHDIKLIDFMDFLSQEDKAVVDLSNQNHSDIDYSFYRKKAVSKLVENMKDNDLYHSSILLGFHPFGFDSFFFPQEYYDFFRSKNCKLILWQDDLHAFPEFPSIADFCDSKDYSKCYDKRLDLIDIILTPSKKYFTVLHSQYLNKTIQYFYSLNEDWFSEIQVNDFENRKNKILLSGDIGPYPLRLLIYNILQNKNCVHDEYKNLSDIFERLPHTGYDKSIPNFHDSVGKNYLKILSKYKGAFFGYLGKPLLFNLAKIIEILMSGALGFFECSPLLKEELGLIEFQHYVPATNEQGNLINDKNYYLKYMTSEEGKRIALNGANYVRTEFTSNKRIHQLISILKNV